MLSLQSDKITDLGPNANLTFTFYVTFSNSKPNWTTLKKKFSDSMLSLERDERTALWPNDSLIFTFYVTFSNSIPNWTIFVKEVFLFDV